jgi:hypothetical protein
MTQKEILEYNKRCAEFLGVDVDYSTEVYKDSKSPLRHYINNKPKSEPLLFHSDWNWIMKMIEKILDIALEIDSMEMYYNITDAIPDINATTLSINQFLIWYERNK